MKKQKRYAVDTNAILRDGIYEIAEKYPLAIPSMIIRELEIMENNPDKYGQRAWNAREKRRRLKAMDKIYFDLNDYIWREDDQLSKTYADNNLLQYCIDTGSGLITYDGLLAEKAIEYGVEVIDIDKEFDSVNSVTYKGYKEVSMTAEEHQDFYKNSLGVNVYNLLENEYLIILDDINGEELDALKWKDNQHAKVISRSLKSQKLEVFKPKDLYQACAVDSVMNNQLSMLRGSAGTAKTLISISYALHEIQENYKYNKLIIFSNAIPTTGAYYHGLVKGDLQEKLLQSSIGNILTSKLGSKSAVEAMLLTEDLMILPASDIRGFDSTGMNAILLVTEAQNWDKELLKLGIQRLGEDCKMIIEGDNKTQIDIKSITTSNGGMNTASQVFRGEEYYGEVELKNIYRSKVAERAELMSTIT